MKTLEIPVKFTNEDTVYTTKQTNLEIPCDICEAKGTIVFNNKNMRCPECHGKGKYTSNKKFYVVCDEPFVISTTKINISSNGHINVRYKGRCGFNNYSRGEDNLFLTKEEAQQKCNELNKAKIHMAVEDIIIPEEFKLTTPSLDKIQERLDYYKENNKFEKYIVINRDMVLQDGYITYLLCKLLNINYVNVVVED
jgi:excinuclease UvrABC ATPase subunit